jgi:hypothetical protein
MSERVEEIVGRKSVECGLFGRSQVSEVLRPLVEALIEARDFTQKVGDSSRVYGAEADRVRVKIDAILGEVPR